MERDEPSGGDAYVEARIPAALYDRIEALFREHRGYEPASVQECLSVVGDLAERQIRRENATAGGAASSSRPEAGERAPRRDEPGSDGTDRRGTETTGADPEWGSTTQLRDAIDDVFPTDWAASEQTERLLPRVIARYAAERDADTRARRENAALSSVAASEGTTPEKLRRTLIDDIYGGSALPGDLASEFFSEALEKVERRVDDPELEPETAAPGDGDPPADAPDSGLDLGPDSDDLPPGLADEMASDGGAVQSVDERVDNLFTGPNGLTEIGLDSMIAGARTDCEICGETRSIESLETTTEASDDRRVNLVCPDCL